MESKDNFNYKNTFRIYDSDLVNRLNKAWSIMKSDFKTKNPFLVEIFKRGIISLEKEVLSSSQQKNAENLFSEMKNIIDTLNKLINLSGREFNNLSMNSKIQQRLLSSSYNMLLGLSDDNPKSVLSVEKGYYDSIPERLINIMGDVIEFL